MAILHPQPWDGTSYWRAHGPFRHLERHFDIGLELDFVSNKDARFDWSDIISYDAFFFQRPHTDNALRLIQKVQSMKRRVWVDFDDNLFEVPRSNDAFEAYATPEAKMRISTIARLADVVTVSTPALQQIFLAFNKNTIVVENAWDDYENFTRNVEGQFQDEDKKYLVWRGSRCHEGDLLELLPILEDCFRLRNDWKWTFAGYPNPYVLERLKAIDPGRVSKIPGLDPQELIEFMDFLRPSIGIVPLQMNEFNKSKSNIAWQEMTFGGACVLAADVDEFRKPGITTYYTAEDFRENLKRLMDDRSLRIKNYNASRSYIEKKLLLSHINQKRADICLQITESLKMDRKWLSLS